MALDFNGATNYSHADDALFRITGPISIGMWWKSNTMGNFKYLVSKDRAGPYPSFGMGTNGTGDLRFIVGGSTTFAQSGGIASATVFDDNWHWIMGTYDQSNVVVMIDGTSATSGVSFSDPIDYTSTTVNIGSYDGSSLFAQGRAAEVAIWSAALTLDDGFSLGKGFSPRMIRPGKLVAYWPLLGRGGSTEPEVRHALDMTLTAGASSVAVHPRIITPNNDQIRRYSTPVLAPQTKGKQFMPFFG